MIAILVNSLIGGGAERVALNLLSGFADKGIKGLVICLEKEQNYPVPEGVEVIHLTSFDKIDNPIVKLPWVLVSAFRLRRIVRERNIQLVQSHLVRSNMVNTIAKWLGSPHKAQIVSHLPLSFADKPFPVRQLSRGFSSWYYRQADQVIAISEQMRQVESTEMSLDKYELDHRVIHNPHDLSTIQALAKEEPEGFRFDPEKEYLIAAGRLQKHKRVDDLIQALELIRQDRPQVELLVLGKGDEEVNLKRRAAELGLTQVVHFLGYKNNPFAFIARANAYVMASESEGLPNILIEALAVGTPVISSDCVSGPREILSPESDFRLQLTDELEHASYGILYPVGKVRLLAKAVQQLLGDKSLVEDYRKAGLERVKQFDRSVICREYLQHIWPEKLSGGEPAEKRDASVKAV